jgi:hypothetical protein
MYIRGVTKRCLEESQPEAHSKAQPAEEDAVNKMG